MGKSDTKPVTPEAEPVTPVEVTKKPTKSALVLQELDQQSQELQAKLRALNERKDMIHATKGWDHPSIKKLSRKGLTLSKKLGQLSRKRYKLRTGGSMTQLF